MRKILWVLFALLILSEGSIFGLFMSRASARLAEEAKAREEVEAENLSLKLQYAELLTRLNKDISVMTDAVGRETEQRETIKSQNATIAQQKNQIAELCERVSCTPPPVINFGF